MELVYLLRHLAEKQEPCGSQLHVVFDDIATASE